MGGRADRQACADGERGPPSARAEILLCNNQLSRSGSALKVCWWMALVSGVGWVPLCGHTNFKIVFKLGCDNRGTCSSAKKSFC
jgi:hypothetical protein